MFDIAGAGTWVRGNERGGWLFYLENITAFIRRGKTSFIQVPSGGDLVGIFRTRMCRLLV